jgi:type VI protein secretion system component Hcp
MKRITGLLVLAFGFLLGATPATADLLFLRLPGITGSSTVEGHVGDIEIVSFSAAVSARRGVGATCSDLSVNKFVDSTSPLLIGDTLAGVDFPQATLIFAVEALGSAVDVYTIKLNNASIVSVQNSGISGAGFPTESVALHATSWVSTFTPQGGGAPVTTTVTCR